MPRPPRLRLRLRPTVSIASAVVGVLALGIPSPAAAGTASIEGTTVRFADPAGAVNRLDASVDLPALEADPLDLGGWRVAFQDQQFVQAPTAGPGCREGSGTAEVACPTGAAPPAVAIDLGGGDDDLELQTTTLSADVRAMVVGGPGNDRIATFQTFGTIDGGAGDDVLVPDDRGSVNQLPPEATPGGVILGGAGTDTVDYQLSLTPIDVSLDGRANDGRGNEGDNVMPDVENVRLSRLGGTVLGSAQPNVLNGGDGADRIVDGGDVVTAQDVEGGTPCEKVLYAPSVPSSLRLRSKRIVVPVSCPTASAATCSGSVRLTSTAGRKVGSASYRVKPGKKATVSVRVASRPARKAVLIVAPTGTSPTSGRAVTVR